MTTDQLTLTGLIATTPRHIVTSEGLAITSFRLASQQRKFDKATERWADAETNWYTVTAFRDLAINASQSLHKGDRVVTVGRVKVRDWSNDDRSGTSIEVEAESLGHDLHWGVSQFKRGSFAGADPEEDTTEEDQPVEA
jgi:single-strand DNA-binding protein